MKNCTSCQYAEWAKTASGKLHPSGNGQCKYKYKVPALPQSMYWLGRCDPIPNGGRINRHKELKDHCAYFGRHDG